MSYGVNMEINGGYFIMIDNNIYSVSTNNDSSFGSSIILLLKNFKVFHIIKVIIYFLYMKILGNI
jgi:hypothetical protein